MKWTDETPKPRERSFIIRAHNNDVRMTVSRDDDEQTWMFFSLSFGLHTDDDTETAREHWPRAAIMEARAILDELEQEL